MAPEPAPAARPAAGKGGRAAARLARRVRDFAARHGAEGTEGHLAYLGARGYRLVLVGADGAWGDLVAPEREPLEAAAERAGVRLREALDGGLAGRMRTGPYEWRRMAGIQLGG
ncbi:hypothetical protein D7294_13420 [Streptomyces hoynatensis]|uniref:Uncharacterized protein n=1 Tax=Streptomyces hoynatensis TaxID=1141874 RepID=A0A3A9Z5H6_9ACTN|nr:hypothetical protein [Streptomyces hoynatensis]RKN42527.1 hypothetical protein D7294_13420 [Streptomyces hoynatensis]